MKKKQNKGNKRGFKHKPGAKSREHKCVLVFDDQHRQEFLTGFHKRKVERRKAAVQEMKNKIKEEEKKVREQRHTEFLKMLQERREALDDEDEDELEEVITGTTECVQYDHPNHTVTVTTISDLDLTSSHLLQTHTSQQEDEDSEDEEKHDEDEKIQALPKTARKPLLSKKVKSLSASLQAFTKQKKRKGKQEVRGRGSNQEEKSPSVATGNKRRLGRTTKKQRRRRTGKRGRDQD